MIDSGHRALVERLNAVRGTDLRLVASSDHGATGGAAFARTADGTDVVVTRSTVSADRMRSTAEVINEQRSRGLPVPEHLLVAELGAEVVVVQERLPGGPVRQVDVAAVDAIVAVNDLFSGRLSDRLDVAVPALFLRRSGADFPRHETLAGHSDRSRRLLRRIQQIGAGEPAEMVGTDLVHTDLTAPNVLFDAAGRVTGVVDWNGGVARGDRHFALVKLIFDLSWDLASPGGAGRVDPAAVRRVEDVLRQRLDPSVITLYWAHWTLTMLHWTIRSGDPQVVDLHLALGEQVLG